ncbi:DUF1559 domain-containing protein [Kolteria novifilia]|uniref:DUF1559 domain-containing protein n=1 Tax=Kolteria novifilia TaxID=2527975 RepID=UPI003AF3B108
MIAIIGVLVALLLPAVQQARESARRTQCSSRMRQLGIAMQNYVESHGVYPFTSTWATGSSNATCPASAVPIPNNRAHNWVEFILPYVEKQQVFDRIDFDQNNSQTGNAQLLTSQKFSFITCPSNPYADSTTTVDNAVYCCGPTEQQGLHYVVSAGTSRPDNTTPDCPSLNSFCSTTANIWQCSHEYNSDQPGIFALRGISRIRNADVSDGLSKTFLLGERNAELTRHGGAFSTIFPAAYMAQRLNSPSADPGNTSLYRQNAGFSSHHPGGGHFVMADSSVKFISDAIDFNVYCLLGDRNDGNIVEAP